ncbi:hypothetical protein JB92DRAFT_108222 [Gautieria morchelliformis]|nr:hypothetical protein JB92DRAFT_108222 [Gautieria morchelliformis]
MNRMVLGAMVLRLFVHSSSIDTSPTHCISYLRYAHDSLSEAHVYISGQDEHAYSVPGEAKNRSKNRGIIHISLLMHRGRCNMGCIL